MIAADLDAAPRAALGHQRQGRTVAAATVPEEAERVEPIAQDQQADQCDNDAAQGAGSAQDGTGDHGQRDQAERDRDQEVADGHDVGPEQQQGQYRC